MNIKLRKERERDEKKELILNAARDIIKNEGMENLSVRKIARNIEYSPTIIYHYFRDKEDIINHLLWRSYQKIVSALVSVQDAVQDPEERFKEGIRRYIEAAMEMSDEFRAILLSSSPVVLEHTSVLARGAFLKRPAFSMLCQNVKDLYSHENVDDNLIELTAQVIWTSVFGLIIRMIMEEVDEAQKQRLTEHFLDFTVNGIPAQKSKHA